MEKSMLERFIAKYNLGGACESVIFKSDGTNLSVKAISDDKNVLGEVVVETTKFPEGEFAVYETKKLRSILSVLNESLTIKPITNNTKTTGLNVTDGETKATFVLADASIIPAVPELKKLPLMEFAITLDEKFVNTFIKAKGALSEVDSFAVMSNGEGKTATVVIGYSTLNTNRISINATTDAAAKLEPISFSANYLKEILSANKEVKNGTLEVSSKGLARASFTANGMTSVYYLVNQK